MEENVMVEDPTVEPTTELAVDDTEEVTTSEAPNGLTYALAAIAGGAVIGVVASGFKKFVAPKLESVGQKLAKDYLAKHPASEDSDK